MTTVDILGESAVRSLVLAVAVAAGLKLLRIQHARIAKRAWTAVLVLALAMPALVAWHIPSFSVTALWAAPPPPTTPPTSRTRPAAYPVPVAHGSPSLQQHAALSQKRAAPPAIPPIPVAAALRSAPSHTRPIPWPHIGFTAYLGISALMVLRVLAGLLLSVRLWRRAQHFTTSDTRLPVRLTVDLHSPVTLAHGILLPLEAIAWDEATLRATLAHEEAHVREGDFYLQLAASLHLCLFWISPLAWWLRPQLARLSETICDRAAVASTGDGLSYAQLLLRFATVEHTPAGMVAMAQSAGLRERVERLIADPQLGSAFRQRRGQAIGAALLFGASAVAAAATLHIAQPESAVLAAPQAPAAPEVAQPTSVSPPDAPPAVSEAQEAAPTDQAAPNIAPVPPTSAVVASPEPDVVVHVNPVIASRPIASIALMTPWNVPAMPQVEVGAPVASHRQSFAIYGPAGGSSSHFVGGDWFHDELHFAGEAKKHPGGAILFLRDGKTWVIDNPSLVKQAQEAYAPVEDLGKQQGELGEKQGALGEQQGKLGELQGELGEKQGEWAARHLDFPKGFKFDMPEGFNDAVNQLAQSATKLAMNEESLNASQRAALEAQQKDAQANLDKMMEQFKAQEPQREAWAKQMQAQGEQMRKEMQPLIKQMQELGAKQGELGRLQGELGRQQALLGQQQSKASHEAEQKVQSLIDQAVRDGSAHPVQ